MKVWGPTGRVRNEVGTKNLRQGFEVQLKDSRERLQLVDDNKGSSRNGVSERTSPIYPREEPLFLPISGILMGVVA